MAITWEFGSDNTVVIKFIGHVKYEEIISFLKDIKQELEHCKELYELVLFSNDINVVINSETAQLVAEKVRDNLSCHSRGALALVCATDHVFGLCRQLGMRVERDEFPVDAFRSEAAAREWLDEIRALDLA